MFLKLSLSLSVYNNKITLNSWFIIYWGFASSACDGWSNVIFGINNNLLYFCITNCCFIAIQCVYQGCISVVCCGWTMWNPSIVTYLFYPNRIILQTNGKINIYSYISNFILPQSQDIYVTGTRLYLHKCKHAYRDNSYLCLMYIIIY